MMAASVIGATGLVFPGEESDLDLLKDPFQGLPKWSHAVAVRTGAGYKDNVTLSHFTPEASGLLVGGLEYTACRLPLDGTEVTLFLDGEHRQFLSSESVEREDLVLAQARVNRFLGERWQASLAAEYFYQDQVIDASATEPIPPTPVVGHTLAARPALRCDVAPGYWVEAQPFGSRQLFSRPLDDYWEFGGLFTLGLTYGHKSEITVSYEVTPRLYDSEEAFSAEGERLPGTQRRLLQQEVRWSWRHTFDAAGRWRVTTRLGCKLNRDQGEGWFDFTKIYVAEQLRFRARGFEATAGARFANYDYPVQTVSATDPATRNRHEVILSLRCEQQLVKWLRLYAQFEHERTFSNLAAEEYSVNTVTGGLSWEF